jgi:type I restriction enzyme S subunit
MKEGWDYKKLGEICSLLTDGDWIESKDQSCEGIRLIQTGNIGNGIYKDKTENSKYISEDTFVRLNCTEIFEGDVLVSRLPDPIGRSCIIPKSETRMITAVDCSIVRLKEIILPKMFVYFSMSDNYSNKVLKVATGTTRKRISRKNLSMIKIPLPPLSEQQRIVEELDLLSSIIEKKKEQLKELDNLAQSIFYDMFGDPVTNEKGWEVKKLGDEFEVSSGGTPSTGRSEYWDNGNVSWIGSNMCQNQVIYENDGKYITKEGLEHSSAKLYHKGFVLVALVGATIGKVALLGFNTTTNQNIAGINVPKNKDYTPFFIYFLLQFLYCMFENIGEGKFKMANLTFIRSLPIIKPPLPLQQQFASKIEAIERQKELIKQSIKEVETLFSSSMDYYFN